MKIGLLGDLHAGIRRDDKWVADYQIQFIRFYRDECKRRGVTATIQTGDFFDVRPGMSQETMNLVRNHLAPAILDVGEAWVLVGNHDMHLKHKIHPNSCTEYLSRFEGMHIVDTPTTVSFADGVWIDLIPWICDENHDQVMEHIANTTADYCVGHFELGGFYYYTGLKSEGVSHDFLSGYKEVWSGHYHCQSERDNVKYLGTPYTLTAGDAGDSRGFWIFDTETRELEYVENPNCWHYKVYFNADTFDVTTIKHYKDKYVKLIVEKRTSDTRAIDYDVILERFSQVVHDIKPYESFDFDIDSGEDATQMIEAQDTKQFVDDYIMNLEGESEEVKTRARQIFSGLYVEALNLDQ